MDTPDPGGTGGAVGRHQNAADPVGMLNQLGTLWSDDLDAYAVGKLDAAQITCVLCMCGPCRCPAFGTPEYVALVNWRHGRAGRVCPGCEGRGAGEMCQVCGQYIPPRLRGTA